ncbi:aspartyl-phosphate phosphatase Spo0E family protein [Desulfitobacterium sp.]|uniref:aspartyl-phosphate phosphatase Spo0E family protein n=1 Tax=Desulfitobacterium sp. TaxID=49981 RepID=UPI002BB91BF1|nr:aspartyl-phosphate phosphatase Spo0E family protein [Desulfitobacterium sp.]HVJ50709.1 aspartyl-phosphate phosphatase Spo0E family protein [Desulfitobacterium sp.]
MEKKLLRRIEALRKRLNKLGTTHDLVDDEVVAVSQQLDQVLNEYQKIISYHQLSFW